MNSDTQESAVDVVATPGGAAASPSVEQLQAEISAIKAKAALQAAIAPAGAEVAPTKVTKKASKKTKAKVAKIAKKTGKTAKKAAKADAPECTFEGCDRSQIAKGLCPSHYRQLNRGEELKPLRLIRGLVRLPMVIRVEQETFDLLEKRIKAGLANSMYDATRQALEAGIASWG